MRRLPQISRPNTTNISGLDLIRLIDSRDIAGLLPPEIAFSGSSEGVLPVGGLIPNAGAVWIDMWFEPGMAAYTGTLGQSVHGPSVKHQLTLPIPKDSPDYGMAMRMLSKGRWMALAMDGNELVKLVGTPQQPLKLKQATLTTIGKNMWTAELVCETLRPAYYMTDWGLDALYGNPADYSFDFSLDFNA